MSIVLVIEAALINAIHSLDLLDGAMVDFNEVVGPVRLDNAFERKHIMAR